MSDNKFDDFLKQSFSDYTPDVPRHIWDNIAAERQKKRPAGFWLNDKTALLIIAGLLLLGGGTYFAVNQNKNSKNIALENNGSRQEAVNAVPAAVLKNNTETGTAGENSLNTSSEEINSAAVLNSQTKEGDIPGINKSNLTEPGKYISHKRNIKFYSKKIKQQTTAFQSLGTGDVIMVNDHDDNSMSGDLKTGDELFIPYLQGSRDNILRIKESIFEKQALQLTPQLLPFTLKEDCPVDPAGNKYYIEAYISPDYVIKKYNDTGNSVLVSKRKESLRIQSGYSAGLRYTRVFGNGMSIRSGINYSRVNEKFSYAQDNIVQIIYVINNAGDTTDSYYVRGTRYRNSYNRYHTIDVPVVVGYEMGNGNFHANINAGAVINIYSWQKGETLDNNGTPVSITTGKDDNPYQYKTNVGVGFTGAVSLYYKFNDRFHVLAEPYFRYNFSPMNKEALSIQEKFTTIGLRLGIRMDIK